MEEIKTELDKFVDFCRSIKINNPEKGLIPFELYDYQKEVIQDYLDHKNVIYTKFHQGGFSTLNAAYGLWKALNDKNKHIVFITNTSREAKVLFQICCQMTTSGNIPVVHYGNKFSLDKNGNTIEFRNIKSIRELAITDVFLDEIAFCLGMEHWDGNS